MSVHGKVLIVAQARVDVFSDRCIPSERQLLTGVLRI